jgi:hypothetical protein
MSHTLGDLRRPVGRRCHFSLAWRSARAIGNRAGLVMPLPLVTLNGPGDELMLVNVSAALASTQAAIRPQNAGHGRETTGSDEAPQPEPTCSFDAFAQAYEIPQ